MKFEEILPHIKAGEKACRKGWNGANQWVKKIDSRCWKVEPSVVGDFAEVDILVLKNAQDRLVAWIPSLGDLFAEDWEVIK